MKRRSISLDDYTCGRRLSFRCPGVHDSRADFQYLCVDIDDLGLHVSDDNRLLGPPGCLQHRPIIPAGRVYVNYFSSVAFAGKWPSVGSSRLLRCGATSTSLYAADGK